MTRSKSKYRNNYEARLRRVFWTKIFLYIFGIFLLIGVVFYVLFFAKLFDIRNVSISTPASINKKEVEVIVDDWLNSKKFWIKNRSNYLLFSPNGIKKSLIEAFPKISNLEIKRVNSNDLEIKLIERLPVGIWCFLSTSDCVFFDKDSIAYSSAYESTGYLFPRIIDKRDRTYEIGKKVEEKKFIDDIFSLMKTLQFGGLGVDYFEISNSYQDLYVYTTEGWYVILAINGSVSIADQSRILNNFLKEKLKPAERVLLEYVDLRVKDRIYYK